MPASSCGNRWLGYSRAWQILEGEGIAFPFESRFCGVHVYGRCSGWGQEPMGTAVDTKY
jgi:hypothetical protein